MILRGARVALGPDDAAGLDVEIRDGRIVGLGEVGRRGPTLDLSGYLLLPGLINAHDHLEFNLFPRLGRGPYPNAAAWAESIYRPDQSPIREHLEVPKRTRLAWGGLKNLLSGVTTVCHHNPYEAAVFERRFPVRVVKRFGWAHSLAFSPDLAERFRRAPHNGPFIVHVGEATDAAGSREIFRLNALGALCERTVMVHAVALDSRGLRLARQRGAALITCPSSNLFLLGRTLEQCDGILAALGTDSGLTCAGDLLDELRVLGGVARKRYRMVTDVAAQVLRLQGGAGAIVEQGIADLIAVRDRGRGPAETLCAARRVELVLVGGRIKLVSVRLARQVSGAARRRLAPLHVEGRGRVLVDADVRRLRREAEQALGRRLRLAGKRVLP